MAHSAVLAFDLYGTLLSTESISKRLTEIIGSQEKGTKIAASWRKYQLEYSWRLTCMGMSRRFYNTSENVLIMQDSTITSSTSPATHWDMRCPRQSSN